MDWRHWPMSNTEHLRHNFHIPHLTSTRSLKLATSFQGGDGTANPLFYAKSLKPFARQLRSNMTESESLLWHRIRKKQLRGIQFLRQKPIATFILDFYAKEIKLAIEVDGGQHFTDSHQTKDANRDAYLATLGIKTLRFTNTEILKNCTGALYCIEQSIVSLTSFEGGRERFLRAGGC